MPSLSTVIAVFENLIAWLPSTSANVTRRTRRRLRTAALVAVLSLPCAPGLQRALRAASPFPGIGDIQSIEDFIVSNNMLPLGSLIFVIFCTTKFGWGWDNFIEEADKGKGVKLPVRFRLWYKYGIPVLIVIIFVMGYVPKISAWMGM